MWVCWRERQKDREERVERETKFFILFFDIVYIILMSCMKK